MEERITVKKSGFSVPKHPTVPFIEGDGIGREVTEAAKLVVDRAIEKAYGDRSIEWLEVYAGEKAKEHVGEYLPKQTIDSFEKYRVGFKGPLTTPVGGGFRSINVAIRQKLDLYCVMRPVKYVKGVPSPMKEDVLDVIIFREAIEDVYAGIEYEAGTQEAGKVISFLNKSMKAGVRDPSGIGIKPISRFGSERLMKMAIKYALENKRKSITIMHKGNIMKFTEGAFREWCYNAAKPFGKNVVLESELKGDPKGKLVIKDRIADSMFQQLLLRPEEYDIIVCTNLNGDFLSEAASAQVGGVGIAPSGNVGDWKAVFEPTHGSAPKYAGQDKVNPGSAILSTAMMLDYIGWKDAARLIENAMGKAIRNKRVTYDLERMMNGAKLLKCSEFAKEVAKNM
ncbi:MAG: isocitrate dehydrogenase (NADP(+)) [Candidatus Aenigmarchaeota archaeon]|nr:isocitrate dehydrogenase (NADP(+)) [Candidatus Aenigmarchaeota archaeon]